MDYLSLKLLLTLQMTSRSEHIRQLGLKGKIMYKSGTSILDAKIFDSFDSEEKRSIRQHDSQSSISTVELSKPSSSSNQVAVLEPEEDENRTLLTDNYYSYTKLTPVPNVIIEDITIITEKPLDATQKTLMSCDDPISDTKLTSISDGYLADGITENPLDASQEALMSRDDHISNDPIPDDIIEDITIATETPDDTYNDTLQEMLIISDNNPNSERENPFNDSGSSFKLSGNTLQSIIFFNKNNN